MAQLLQGTSNKKHSTNPPICWHKHNIALCCKNTANYCLSCVDVVLPRYPFRPSLTHQLWAPSSLHCLNVGDVKHPHLEHINRGSSV